MCGYVSYAVNGAERLREPDEAISKSDWSNFFFTLFSPFGERFNRVEGGGGNRK